MSLQGSGFSGGGQKPNRLSKMSSVPTTEDLRYALAESKKHNKAVELPFENNRNPFVIKVQQSGNATPRWTFMRGDGPTAKIIWTRDSAEVLMIQNKIKTESAYESIQNDNVSSGYQAPYVPDYSQSGEVEQYDGYDQSQDYDQGYDQASNYASAQQVPAAQMGFGSAPSPAAAAKPAYLTPQGGFGGGFPQAGFGAGAPDAATSQSTPAWSPQGGAPNASTSQTGMSAWQPQSANAQQQSQSGSSIPQQGFSEQSASGRQVQFQPSGDASANSKILMPPKLVGSAEFSTAMAQANAQQPQAQVSAAPPHQVPNVDPVYQGNDKAGDNKKVAFDMSGIFGNPPPAPATTAGANQNRLPPLPEPSHPKMPLPAPVSFDQNMINAVYAKLLDGRTGLMLFDSFLFFLFREFSRYEKYRTGFTFFICEVALKQNNQMIALPAEALAAVGQRIGSALSASDVAAYINGNDFAVLANTADPTAVTALGKALHSALTSSPLLPGWPADSVVVSIGAASIPNTCEQVGVVVSAAQSAKELAKGSSPAFMIFPA